MQSWQCTLTDIDQTVRVPVPVQVPVYTIYRYIYTRKAMGVRIVVKDLL